MNDLLIYSLEKSRQMTTDERLARTQPTIGHHLQILVFHEGHHCGALSSWRKAQRLSGIKGIFAS